MALPYVMQNWLSRINPVRSEQVQLGLVGTVRNVFAVEHGMELDNHGRIPYVNINA